MSQKCPYCEAPAVQSSPQYTQYRCDSYMLDKKTEQSQNCALKQQANANERLKKEFEDYKAQQEALLQNPHAVHTNILHKLIVLPENYGWTGGLKYRIKQLEEQGRRCAAEIRQLACSPRSTVTAKARARHLKVAEDMEQLLDEAENTENTEKEVA